MLNAPFFAPPDTSRYMIAGYVVIFAIQGLYLLSLWLRWRKQRREMAWLDEMQRRDDGD